VNNSADERKTDAFSSCSPWDAGYGDRLQNTVAKVWEVLLLGHVDEECFAHTGRSECYKHLKSVIVFKAFKKIEQYEYVFSSYIKA